VFIGRLVATLDSGPPTTGYPPKRASHQQRATLRSGLPPEAGYCSSCCRIVRTTDDDNADADADADAELECPSLKRPVPPDPALHLPLPPAASPPPQEILLPRPVAGVFSYPLRHLGQCRRCRCRCRSCRSCRCCRSRPPAPLPPARPAGSSLPSSLRSPASVATGALAPCTKSIRGGRQPQQGSIAFPRLRQTVIFTVPP
jgi:hypothetical protein